MATGRSEEHTGTGAAGAREAAVREHAETNKKKD